MDEFDSELDSLTDAFKKDEQEKALKRRFEESKLWDEHRRWHEEQGTPAKLEVWEETITVQPETPQAAEAPVQRHVMVGGCNCQPKSVLMLLDERGEVAAGIPAPVEEQKQYTAAPAETQTYNPQPGTPNNQYNASGQAKDLYR